MRALRDKIGMIAHLIIAASVVMTLNAPAHAKEKVEPRLAPLAIEDELSIPVPGKGPAPMPGQPETQARPPMPSNLPTQPKPSMPANASMQAKPPMQGRPPAQASRPPMPGGGPSLDRARGAKRPMNVPDAEVYRVVPQKCVPATGQFVWNFEEEELVNVLRQISDLLCKTFVINEAISKNQKFTIIGKSPMYPKDAWNILNAAMAAKGLALVEQGKTWTVIKRNEGKNFYTPFYSAGLQANNNEEIGTLFYKAEHATPDALKNIARFLLSKDGIVETIGDQFIIVIDTNSIIRRLGTIIAQVDIEDALDKIHFIALQHADAKSVEKQLRDLFEVSGSPGARRRRPGEPGHSSLNIRKIIADERMNGIIVETDPGSLEKLKEVVALIDQPASEQATKGKIHVYRLRYADSKKIAETLNAVVQQGGRGRQRFGRRPDEATNELFEGEVKVTAHENTNTLVTVATANDWRSLLATIKSLDIRKEQVYVEAVIMDVRINDNSEFGINAFSGLSMDIPGLSGSSLGIVGNAGGREMASGLATAAGTASSIDIAGSNSVGALAMLSSFAKGGIFGLVGPVIPGTKIPSFGAVLQAMAMNSNIDILSTPSLLTSDNTEAVMKVGEKIPMVRGTSTVGGGSVGGGLGVPLQNITYENVDLTFKITPHVGADRIIRIDIEQEVNEIGDQTEILGAKQYRINTKSAKTTIVLKDQQTGVIGGLISNRSQKSDRKVPFLGDIPLLGWLFKSRESSNDRKSLLLILTPYIIKDESDYEEMLKKKFKEREEFADLYFGGKIKTYNRTINYDKKAGPLSNMILSIDAEMNKVENGGPGDGSETVIVPKEKSIEPKPEKKPEPPFQGGESQTPAGSSIETPLMEGEGRLDGSVDLDSERFSDVTMFGPEEEAGAEIAAPMIPNE